MSVFEEEKLPSSFLHEVVSKSQDTIVLRSNVRNLEECGKWALEFGDATKTEWNSRSSNPNGERFVCWKKFVCHHSGFMKVSADANKRSFSKNSNCNATINIKVKLDTATSRRKDSFIQVSKF
ncbi:hypothetical protein AVEN_17119-1 [Araneus ventricosus]|uniref:FAR1 domain-containing protein n=1 Tax=Araneus ventricosus TaxID=182803 RepID=A0A4Y2NIN4_ARAVE|nr:hypothetical protein AVEN_17119-1 [Araneus ventricosus]